MAGRRPSTATVLFTDVVASTAFRVARGDDLADEVRRRHDEAIRAAAAEHLGEVVKGTGDGVMIVFPAAAQGLNGAVAIQRAVHRLERSLRDASLAIRVGVSAGDIVWEDDDCYGTPVVEAARLCDAAEPGEILVSDIVRMLAGSRSAHVLEPRGVMSLKGLGDVTVFEVRWESETGGSKIPLPAPLDTGDTLPLIGRETALDAVMAAFK
jgi:class 3 adenylate cyclase